MFQAHSENKAGRRESLAEHLTQVSRRAAGFAAVFGAGQQAKAAGLLHDLGKYADQFQRRLKDPGREPSRNHWTAGAALLLQCYKGLGMLPSLAVGGHHAGLTVLEPDQKEYLKSLAHTLGDANVVTDSNVGRLRDRFGDDGLTFPGVEAGLESAGNSADDMLNARMLFSALVDADFIETEAHFEGDDQQPRRYRPEGPALEPEGRWPRNQPSTTSTRTFGGSPPAGGNQCAEFSGKVLAIAVWAA